MHMIRKGQIEGIGKKDVLAQKKVYRRVVRVSSLILERKNGTEQAFFHGEDFLHQNRKEYRSVDEIRFNSRVAFKEDFDRIVGWLGQDYVAEWFYGEGLRVTTSDLEKFLNFETSVEDVGAGMSKNLFDIYRKCSHQKKAAKNCFK